MTLISQLLPVLIAIATLIARPSYAFHLTTHTTISIRVPTRLTVLPPPKSSSSQIDDETEVAEAALSRPQKPPPTRRLAKRNVRMQIFSFLNLPIAEVAAASAVLLSTFLVALSTLNDLPPEAYIAIQEGIVGLNIIFALDFFVRWYAAGQFKLKYLIKPLVIIDIFVVLIPLFLGSVMPMLDDMGVLGDAEKILALSIQDSSSLQVLLLLRVLRLRRVLTDATTFEKFEMALGVKPSDVRPYQLQLARVLLSIFTLLSVASGLIYTAEHNVNPGIPDYFTALYFGLTTLTTVGFGDIVPMTTEGRIVVCGSILAGIAVIPAQAAKLVDIFVESQNDEKRPRSSMSSRSTASRRQIDTAMNAIDGMGPSGIPIEIPPKEVSSMDGTALSSKVCRQCGALEHRADANFCWSCGFDMM